MGDPTKTPGQQLSDWALVRNATRIIPDGTEAANVTPEQIELVVDRALSFIHALGRIRKKMAKSMGYSPSVISDFLSRKYIGSGKQVAIDIDRWLNAQEALDAKPRTTIYVETSVALAIRNAAHYALEASGERRTIAMVYGPDTSGIGKTTALQAIHGELGPRRSCVVTFDKVDANPTGTLRRICQALHIDDKGSNAQRYRRVVDKVSGRSFIFLLDQVHNLRWAKDEKPLYILTDIYDSSGTAQLWCGTADLVSYLERQQRKNSDESLAQIRSRIFPCIDLLESMRESGSGEPLFTVEDIRKIFAKNQLRLVGDAPRLLSKICNQPDSGALRLSVNLVEYATAMALQRGLQSIDEKLIQEAMRACFQPRRAELLMSKIDERPVARAKAG
jgi:DNA transposition AAA+ family ATPase